MSASVPESVGRSYRKVNVEHLGGDVFSVQPQSSNRETLWSELFQEKERATMRKHLISRVVAFSIKDTYQISVRMIWTKEAIAPPRPGQGRQDDAVRGPVAVMCHDFAGKLTSSWTWSKLAYPLHKAGISVVMVDFPGFGLSRICGRADVDRSSWIEKDWRIVVQLMDTLKIRKCHLITCGESCNLVLKMLKFVRLRLELTHIFFNPVMDLDGLFPLEGTRQGGIGRSGIKALRAEQRNAFELLLHNSRIKIWAMFDQSTSRSDETRMVLSSFEALPFASDQVTVTHLCEEHICAAMAGSTVQVPMLFPCRYVKHGCIRFLKADHTFKPPPSLLPEQWGDHVAESPWSGADRHTPLGERPSLVPSNLAAPDVALDVAIDVCQRPSTNALPIAMQRARTSVSGRGGAASASALALPAMRKGSPHAQTTLALAASASSPAASWNSMRKWNSNSDGDSILRRAAGFFGEGSSLAGNLAAEGGGGLVLARPCDIKGATKLACEIQRPDVHQERQVLLTNTKAVTKLKNWTEMRGGEAPDREDILPQERVWIEDAMDMSMKSLEEDEERRKILGPEARGGRRRSQNERMLEKLRTMNGPPGSRLSTLPRPGSYLGHD